MLIVLAVFATNFKNGYSEIISSDGRGYYHHFLEYFISDENRNPEWEQSYLSEHNGQPFSKYSIGTSIMLSPFFGMAYGISIITGHELTGYSLPFQILVRVGSLAYLILGGFLLFRFLLSYHIRTRIAFITTLAIVFATNLLYYGVVVSAMSHVYSFATITAWALCVRLYFLNERSKYFLFSAVALGLIVLIRPFNTLVILTLPILVSDLPQIKNSTLRLLRKPRLTIAGGLIFCSIISLQLLVWYDQTGQWILYSYSHEGFYFKQPKIFKVLFSFNKGLFIYTPLLLISVAGVWHLYKRHKQLAISFMLFLGILVYCISSWWCWNYNSHFGLRPFIDYYAFFALPMAAIMSSKNRVLRFAISFLVLLFTALNLIQSYQTKAQILHPIGMNFSQYQHVFLRTGERYEHRLGGHNEIPIFAPNGLEVFHSETIPGEILVNTEFPQGISFAPDKPLTESGLVHWKISLEKFEIDPTSASNPLLVLEFRKKETKELTYYYAFKINEIPFTSPRKWISHSFAINTPTPAIHNTVSCYIWNKNKEVFKVKNFDVEVLVPK